MPTTYKAILTGDRVQWIGDAPATNGAVRVEIELLEPRAADEDASERGAAMAAALQRLADLGGIPEIPDPVEWQREQRKDRRLPGRED